MKNVAIVGASGLVGQEIIKVLNEEGLLSNIKLRLYVSNKSAGKRIIVCGKEYLLEELSSEVLKRKHDVVFFSAGDEISKVWAPKFVKKGAFVIDNTNAFRRESFVPLVVPEINASQIGDSKLIANPNCSTIQLAVVLKRLLNVSKIKSVIVSTYQSVSGAGKKALLDFENNTSFEIKEGITNNVIAKIGKINNQGFSTEEDKIMFETNKILNSSIHVVATAVRVPVCFCHSESVFVEFDNEICLHDIKEALICEHVVFDDQEIFLPTKCVHSNKTFVCRLRQTGKNQIAFFVVADNLRRGAAFNAVKIFSYLLTQKTTK